MKSGSIMSKAYWIAFHQGPMELFKRIWHYLGKRKLREFWIFQNRSNAYKCWLKRESKLIKSKLGSAPQVIAGFSCKPLITIVLPVWNTQANFFEESITSVVKQVYPFWELCILSEHSFEPRLDLLNKYQGIDLRLKVACLAEHDSIVKATNEAVKLAAGEFVGFLDCGDILAPHALLEVVKMLNEKSETDIIYTDEDQLNGTVRLAPFFKPDWSPDLLLSMNYIGNLMIVRKNLFEEVGGLWEEADGGKDYDLILRLSERTTKIVHIPEILYHRKMISKSVSGIPDDGDRLFDTGLSVIKLALERRGIKAEAIKIGCGHYRVKYLIQGNPLVSIMIPTRDRVELLRRCIDSIRDKSAYKNYEIIVVDNGSSAPETLAYFQQIKKSKDCRVLDYNIPFNYSKINNFAVQFAKGDYILFLNNDIEVLTSDWLGEMLSHCQRPEIGAVGVKLLFPDNSVQHAGIVVGLRGVAGHAFYNNQVGDSGYMDFAAVTRNYSAVTAACLMMRTTVFNEVGGFDEELDVAYNDVDICLKVFSKGYFIVWTPHAVLYHHESASLGHCQQEHNVHYFCNKWQTFLNQGDPFYNRNQSLNCSNFKIKQ